tara:strand:+ start:4213 stop:5205 length:993 start_codon:yes stop_codon:yes gene_type:complete
MQVARLAASAPKSDVPQEPSPEGWQSEATAIYQRLAAFRRCFAPCIGHVRDGQVFSGLPELAITTPEDPLASDIYGSGTLYRPTRGLTGFVFRDCGTDLERLAPTLGDRLALAVAGRVVDMLRQLVEGGVLVTDFRLTNIVCTPPVGPDSACPRLWFVDTASIAIGQARPASSFALLAVHFREQLKPLLPLRSDMQAFSAAHVTRDPVTAVRMPIGDAIGLSAKLAVAQLLRFSEVRCANPGSKIRNSNIRRPVFNSFHRSTEFAPLHRSNIPFASPTTLGRYSTFSRCTSRTRRVSAHCSDGRARGLCRCRLHSGHVHCTAAICPWGAV